MDWIALLEELPALAAGVGVVVTVGSWLARKADRALNLLATIEAEFRPNGGGSMRDQEVIDAANERGVAMVFDRYLQADHTRARLSRII